MHVSVRLSKKRVDAEAAMVVGASVVMTTQNDILATVTGRAGPGLLPGEGRQVGEAMRPWWRGWSCRAAEWEGEFVIARESRAAPPYAMVRPDLGDDRHTRPTNRRRRKLGEEHGKGFGGLHPNANEPTIFGDGIVAVELLCAHPDLAGGIWRPDGVWTTP